MPTFPLYRELQAPLTPIPGTMHLGLWFERFFHGYESDFGAVDKEGRSAWLRQLDQKQVGARGELQAKAQKIAQLAASQGGQARIYQCTAPFVTGMGNPHPLESGFTWHPTLGMPYLPGSAVKGLVRAAVEVAYQGEDKLALLKPWLIAQGRSHALQGQLAGFGGQFRAVHQHTDLGVPQPRTRVEIERANK